MAKLWFDKYLERRLRHSHLRHIFTNLPCNLYGKLKSDKQRGEHVYPVLEMLNNKIKGLKLEKIKFENLEKKKKPGKLDTGEPP